MAKKTRSYDDDPAEQDANTTEGMAGGTEGNTGFVPVNPDDLMTEQEKAPAPAYVEPVQPAPAEPMKLGPKEPYPVGDPPTAEDEARRAVGLPREGA